MVVAGGPFGGQGAGAAAPPASCPSQSSSSPLHCSAVGHTALDEHTYHWSFAGKRPSCTKQLLVPLSHAVIVPCLHCPTAMPHGMPLSARFLPSGASTRPSQSSSFGASASHDCGLGCPAPKQRGG